MAWEVRIDPTTGVFLPTKGTVRRLNRVLAHAHGLTPVQPEPNSAEGPAGPAAPKGDGPHRLASPGAVGDPARRTAEDTGGPEFSSAHGLTCADFYTCDIEAREDLECRP